MELYVVLYWVALAACVFALFIAAIFIARFFHRIFQSFWFVFPFILVPPLIHLVRHPDFDSYLWRGLAVVCIAIVVWAFTRALVVTFSFFRREAAPSAHIGFDVPQGSQSSRDDAHTLTWDEALIMVLALEERRLAFDFKPGWLYYQCREVPVLLEAFEYLRQHGHLREHHRESTEHSRNGSRRSSNGPAQSRRDETLRRPPHEVLGVASDASPEQIKAGYREQLKRYHPDRLQHFGTEFAALATEKTKEIQQAYEVLMARADRGRSVR